MGRFKEEDLIGKFVIGFDTLCDGNQCATDEHGDISPSLYDSYDEAFKELFYDAVCGIEGNEEHLEDEEARDKMLEEMRTLLKEGDIEKMKAYMEKEPDSNYYEDFIQKADEFILGRKLIFGDEGAKVVGTKLEDL